MTFAFGDAETPEDLCVEALSDRDFSMETLNRRLDLHCELLQSVIPSLQWQGEMLLWYTHVNDEYKHLVEKYTTFGSFQINQALIKHPDAAAPLNDLIGTAIPLPHDIVVYRFVQSVLNLAGVYEIHGYCSTTFRATFAIKSIAKGGTLFRILIPAGSKCLFIPGDEFELIFPHQTRLNILKSSVETFVYVDCGSSKHTDLLVYDTVMM